GHCVRGQYEGYLEVEGVAPNAITETFVALRVEIENWRWAGVPFFLRTGKCLPVTQTEMRVVFRRPPRLGFGDWGRVPEPAQLVVKIDPSTGIRILAAAQRHDTVAPEQIAMGLEFAPAGGEGPAPSAGLLPHAGMGEARRFPP